MSQHTTHEAKGIRKEKSVATKEFVVATEIAKDSKRSYHDKENSVAIELTGEQGKECHDRFQKDKDMRS